MHILLSIFIAMGFTYFAGFGVTRLLSKSLPISWRWFIPVTGYALSQIIFFFVFILLGDVWQAFLVVIILLGLINGVALWANRGKKQTGSHSAANELQGRISRSALYIIILIVACWPYLLSGWGNYWHSGNEDIMDALHGRDSFLSNTLESGNFDIGVRIRDVAQEQFKVQTGFWSAKLTAGRLTNLYVKDEVRFQYSSVAFWSVLLDAPHKMDAFLIQSLLTLILMSQGVYLVAMQALSMPRQWAILAGLAAVLTNFYLTSYFNGHEGSMMYNAMSPFFLVLGLTLMKSSGWSWKVMILPAIWLLFIANSYPYPLPYLLLPLAVYWLYVRGDLLRCLSSAPSRKVLYGGVLASIVLIALGYWASWVIFEPVRIRAESQFRSWQTVFNYVGFFQYWGIWPSNLANSGTILGYLIRYSSVIWVSGALSVALTGLALIGFRFAWKEGYRFFGFWLAMWLLFFPLMRYVIGDPYYFYKFLYLNLYVVVLMVIFASWRLLSVMRKRPKVILVSLLIITGMLNLANNVIAGWFMSDKLYNRSARYYEQIATIPTDLLSRTFIDIPWADHGDVVRQVVTAAGLKTEADKAKAKYLLRMDGAKDMVNYEVGKTVWRSEIFSLVEAPTHNLVHLVSFWELERSLSDVRALPFRWISDGRGRGFTVGSRILSAHDLVQQASDSIMFIVYVIRPDLSARFLHFCAESGPSLDFKSLSIEGRDGEGNLLGNFVVEGYSCHWMSIEGKSGPFTFSSDVQGKTISPIEPRKLNYRIFMVGLSGDVYDEPTVATISLASDIVRNSIKEPEDGPSKLQLGNGWYNFESFAGEGFRWVNNNAEIVLYRQRGELQHIELDVEPGPSLGKKPLSINILDERGQEIVSAIVTGRQTLNLPIPSGKVTPQLLHIHAVNSDNIPVPNDHRILNFRVFKIGMAAPKN